jgi:hypothetical protein
MIQDHFTPAFPMLMKLLVAACPLQTAAPKRRVRSR